MKLNFWQWLGVALLVIGGIGYLIEANKTAPEKPAAAPATIPSTGHAQP